MSLTGCFIEACDPDKIRAGSNITEICKLNKHMIDIRSKTDNLMKCFNKSDQSVGNNCIDCLNEFNSIANEYKQLEESHTICFDVVDQVKKELNSSNALDHILITKNSPFFLLY